MYIIHSTGMIENIIENIINMKHFASEKYVYLIYSDLIAQLECKRYDKHHGVYLLYIAAINV